MNYTQNEKILQITNETLIIGVDVASETHYARAFYSGPQCQDTIFKFLSDTGASFPV